MTLENELERIAISLETIAKSLENRSPEPVKPIVNPSAIPPVVAPVPVAVVQPVAAVVQPLLVAPPVAQAPACPLTDPSQLVGYVTEVYAEMGPEKGNHILEVLTKYGYQDVNHVAAEHLASIWTDIETLRKL